MNFKDIKLIVCDVDGCLTDGTFYVSDNGVITKGFNTKDFWGLSKIQEEGIRVLLLTGSTDKVIIEKVAQLPKSCSDKMAVENSVFNKLEYLEDYLNELGLKWYEVAYIGDGENDLPSMKKSGFTACPSDALSMIKYESIYVSHLPGGSGAVCDIIMYIINKRAVEMG